MEIALQVFHYAAKTVFLLKQVIVSLFRINFTIFIIFGNHWQIVITTNSIWMVLENYIISIGIPVINRCRCH